MTDTDPRVSHAVAQLDLAARILPGLMRSLEARAELGRQMAADMGVDAGAWQAMSIEDREGLLNRHGREVVPKVIRHAGLTRSAWRALDFGQRLDLEDRWRGEVRDAA